MKTGTTYFYVDNTKTIFDEEKGFAKKHYTVIEVEVFNNNIDEADRKAKTIALKLNEKLAGGYFTSNAKPYNFDTDYTVISCPRNTKIQPYTKQDLFIHNLIESGY